MSTNLSFIGYGVKIVPINLEQGRDSIFYELISSYYHFLMIDKRDLSIGLHDNLIVHNKNSNT